MGFVNLTGKIKQKSVNPTDPGFFLVDAGDVENGLGIKVNTIEERDSIPLYQRDNARIVNVKDVGVFVYIGAQLDTGWTSVGNWEELGSGQEIPDTNLANTPTTTQVTINSSTGAGTIIAGATTTRAGVMTKAQVDKLDTIASGAQVNVKTDLSNTPTSSSIVVQATNGGLTGTPTNLPLADASNAGLMSPAQKTKLDGIEAGAKDNPDFSEIEGVVSGNANLQAALDAKVDDTEKGANGGVATLGGDGKVPTAQLPALDQFYKGTWNASTNTPTIVDGTGTAGDAYSVSVGGTWNSITFVAGDWVRYNGTIWQLSPGSSGVTSVAGKTGAVVLVKSDVGLGNVDDTTDLTKPVSAAQEARVVVVEAALTAHANDPGHLDANEQAGLRAATNPTNASNAVVTVDDLEARLGTGSVGDMQKSTYDTNDDGIVDAADEATHAAQADEAIKLDDGANEATATEVVGHMEDANKHLSTDERNAINNTPNTPNTSNPFATLQDLIETGVGDLLSAKTTEILTPTQDIFGWKKDVSYPIGTALEALIKAIINEYISPAFTSLTFDGITYSGTGHGLTDGTYYSEVESGTTINFPDISTAWTADSAGNSMLDLRFTGYDNASTLLSANPGGTGWSGSLPAIESHILSVNGGTQTTYSWSVTGKDAENTSFNRTRTVTAKYGRFIKQDSSETINSTIARGGFKQLDTNRGGSYVTDDSGANEYIWVSYPTAWGLATGFYDHASPMAMEAPVTFNLTLPDGTTAPYYGYRTTNKGIAALSLVIV